MIAMHTKRATQSNNISMFHWSFPILSDLMYDSPWTKNGQYACKKQPCKKLLLTNARVATTSGFGTCHIREKYFQLGIEKSDIFPPEYLKWENKMLFDVWISCIVTLSQKLQKLNEKQGVHRGIMNPGTSEAQREIQGTSRRTPTSQLEYF